MNSTQIIERFEALRDFGFSDRRTAPLLAMLASERAARPEAAALEAIAWAVANTDPKQLKAARRDLERAQASDAARSLEVIENAIAEALIESGAVESMWELLAGQYTSMGADLVRLMSIVDPDRTFTPDTLALLSHEVLDAYQAMPEVAVQLERRFEPLIALLELAGHTFDRSNPAAYIAAFVASDDTVPDADLLKAWDTADKSRAGRWKALVAAGGRPVAVATPSEYVAPRKAK